MKKILALILAAALALSLVACGSDGTGDSNTPGGENTLPPATDKSVDNTKVIEETKYYQLGDTVSTDIFEFTLDRADLAKGAHISCNYLYCKKLRPGIGRSRWGFKPHFYYR